MNGSDEPQRAGDGENDSDGARESGKTLTITDIARMAGVSKKTVSRVINYSGLVKDDTRQRILQIIEKNQYQPDPQARALAMRRSHLVALVSDQPNPQYVVDFQRGILDALASTRYQLVIKPADRQSPSYPDDILELIRYQKLFGVILTPSISEDDQLIELLKQVDCHYVRVAAIGLDTREHLIETHDYVGAAEAARHIAALGHKRIAHIHGPDHFLSATERLRGFRVGLAEYGLRVDDRYLLAGGYTFESGVECGEKLLAMAERPTAAFAGNDEMAVGVYQAVVRAGLQVPDDLSIVGFDDSPIATRIWPMLTTVRLPIEYMGRTAAQLLISQHDRGSMEPPAATSVMPRLIVRSSTKGPLTR